jgi:RsmE family RNA methyltransferase
LDYGLVNVSKWSGSSELNKSADIVVAGSQKLLSEKTDKSFLDVEIDFNLPITLAIGPERGFIDEDLEAFHQAEFTSVKISSSILRVEHAVYSAISQLELLRARF